MQPPTTEIVVEMAKRIRLEVEMLMKCPLFCGGEIFLDNLGWGANVDGQGKFVKVFRMNGQSKEYFRVEN